MEKKVGCRWAHVLSAPTPDVFRAGQRPLRWGGWVLISSPEAGWLEDKM